jgi:hypothetical protein
VKKKFHSASGLTALLLYIYLSLNAHTFFPGIFTALKSSGVGHGYPLIGILFVVLSPLFSILCLTIPDMMNIWFSPKTSLLGEPILSPGAWVILGYSALALSAILLCLYI